MPGLSQIMMDPRYRFYGTDETTTRDDSAVPFGAQSLFGQGPPGLVGLDPIFFSDPRVRSLSRLMNGLPTISGSGGGQIHVGFDTHPRYLRDLDDKTVANDMYAIAAGHQGTSEGDHSSPFFKDAVERSMHGGTYLGPRELSFMRLLLAQSNQPEFRQQHPGKEAFTPEFDRGTR